MSKRTFVTFLFALLGITDEHRASSLSSHSPIACAECIFQLNDPKVNLIFAFVSKIGKQIIHVLYPHLRRIKKIRAANKKKKNSKSPQFFPLVRALLELLQCCCLFFFLSLAFECFESNEHLSQLKGNAFSFALLFFYGSISSNYKSNLLGIVEQLMIYVKGGENVARKKIFVHSNGIVINVVATSRMSIILTTMTNVLSLNAVSITGSYMTIMQSISSSSSSFFTEFQVINCITLAIRLVCYVPDCDFFVHVHCILLLELVLHLLKLPVQFEEDK